MLPTMHFSGEFGTSRRDSLVKQAHTLKSVMLNSEEISGSHREKTDLGHSRMTLTKGHPLILKHT